MEIFRDGNNGGPLRREELSENLAALPTWNAREFEIPDVIAFGDFVKSDALTQSLFDAQAEFAWGPASPFPYPNGRKLRQLVVLGAPDLVMYRASVGRIALSVERHLLRASFGYRTTLKGLAWHFEDIGRAWKDFLRSLERLIRSKQIGAICATDVTSYYPSIQFDRLEAWLRSVRCDETAIEIALAGLRAWAGAGKTSGLPIGPEASAVLGNAFLVPVDQKLLTVGATHVRWMDDYRFTGAGESSCRAVVDSFDEFLEAQGLRRSHEKTVYYDDPIDAIAALRDPKLTSLGYWLDLNNDAATPELHAAFRREIEEEEEVSRSKFRFILKTLGNRGDDFAALSVAATRRLANIDPKVSGEYLAATGLDNSAVVSRMCEEVSSQPSDVSDALHLHLLRALSRRSHSGGNDEGALFASIAEDRSRRAPIRCWAAIALSCTTRWRQRALMESVEAEEDPLVQRAKLVTLRKVRSGRRRNAFLADICRKFPNLTHTVKWLEAA